MLDLQMKIADDMQAEGWADKTDGERIEEASRRLTEAIRQIYQESLGADITQDTIPPGQRQTCTGQLLLPGV
jgi:hypothetical protein